MARLISGQTTVTSAGTAVRLATGAVDGALAIRALAGNTGVVYVGNDGAGDVTSSNGFELSAKDIVVFAYIGALDNVYVDAATNGDKVSWLILG